jgi:hypothetical protein
LGGTANGQAESAIKSALSPLLLTERVLVIADGM